MGFVDDCGDDDDGGGGDVVGGPTGAVDGGHDICESELWPEINTSERENDWWS